MDSVVPVAMEAMWYEIERGHLGVRDVSAFRIGTAIEFASYAESGLRAGATNEIDDDRKTHQRLATPVGADVGKEPMLDLVPLARSGRQMTDGDRQARAVGQALQFPFPEPHPRAIA